MSPGDPSGAIRAAVLADPCVQSVELTGSRALGTATGPATCGCVAGTRSGSGPAFPGHWAMR